MTLPPKVYKILPSYRVLYEICIDILKEEKSTFTYALLKKMLGIQKTKELSQYDFNELIEVMINNLEKEINETSYLKVENKIKTNSRLKEISLIFENICINDSKRTYITFRISESLIEKIQNLKYNYIGEVIELAIGLFIIQLEQEIFELILLTLEHYEAG
jgi:hypothetical protein